MKALQPLTSSYRDPSGFVFRHDDNIFRFIAPSYFQNYAALVESGLYDALTKAGRMLSHEEKNIADFGPGSSEGKILLPEQLPFISYPYEWSFNMWKDAASVTLKIMSVALEHDMILKDATPFNIQFFKGRPVFIDTLSFEKYADGKPWVAYRQFCECFLGPLLLMHYGHRDAGKFFLAYPDGIPMDVVKAMLPRKAKWNVQVYLHIWLQSKFADKKNAGKETAGKFSKQKLVTLIKGLTDLVAGLKQKKSVSEWDDYYTDTILGEAYLEAKKNVFEKFTSQISFASVIDLGANDGMFSLLLKDKADIIVATDLDSNCINALYNHIREAKIKNIIPLVSRLNHPSPALGWNNTERDSLTDRLKADLVLALALIHHLAISSNISLPQIASWLRNMGEYLVIEFVPKSDEKVKLLLQNREDIFPEYTLASFRNVFTENFDFLNEEKVGDTERILFLLKRKAG